MDNFAFTPANGFLDSAAYPNPNSETETREQLFSLHKQTRDFINANLVDAVTSDTVVKIKANETGFSYSTDGTNYTVIEGSSSGQGDMHTSVYDTNANGIVDNAELVNGHTVLKDVPADAVFTDTVYNDTAIRDRLTLVEGHFGQYRTLLDQWSANDADRTATIDLTGLEELVFRYHGEAPSDFNYIYVIPARALTLINANYWTYIGTVRGNSDDNYVRYYANFSLTGNIVSIIFRAWTRGSGYLPGIVTVYGR